MTRFFQIILLSILITGCTSSNNDMVVGTLDVSIPQADIVFFTLEKNLITNQNIELIGFYSFDNNQIVKVDFDHSLIEPLIVDNNTLIAIDKKSDRGTMWRASGYLFVFHEGKYKICQSETTFGGIVRTAGNSVAISASNGINIVDIEDCSIVGTLLTPKDITTEFPDIKYLGPYSISTNLDNIFLDSDDVLFNYSLIEKRLIKFDRLGVFPSLSPDGTRVTYLSYDGIHLMDFDGENDQLIVPYRIEQDGPQGFYNRGEPPIPKWSPDGKFLIYHKCNLSGLSHCEDINNYSIFIYDLTDGIEKNSLIVD